MRLLLVGNAASLSVGLLGWSLARYGSRSDGLPATLWWTTGWIVMIGAALLLTRTNVRALQTGRGTTPGAPLASRGPVGLEPGEAHPLAPNASDTGPQAG